MGSAMLRYFADKDYKLILHYHESRERLEAILKECDFRNPPITLQADLFSEQAIIHLCGEAQRQAGHVDVLVNNAGRSSAALSWKEDLNEWNDVIQLNLTAPFLMMKHLIPGMRHRGFGRIINISSVVAQVGVPGTAAYAASKSGLFGLTASVSKELANKGVTVNTIALGYMNDGMIHLLDEHMQQNVLAQIPVGKLGRADHLGGLIAYLASDQADYLTGQTINFNGGMYAG